MDAVGVLVVDGEVVVDVAVVLAGLTCRPPCRRTLRVEPIAQFITSRLWTCLLDDALAAQPREVVASCGAATPVSVFQPGWPGAFAQMLRGVPDGSGSERRSPDRAVLDPRASASALAGAGDRQLGAGDDRRGSSSRATSAACGDLDRYASAADRRRASQ